MRITQIIRSAPALFLVGLAACGGGADAEEGTGNADLLGYYTYSDPARGVSHLALMEANRFMLVQEPTEVAGAGAGPVEGPTEGPPVAAPEAVAQPVEFGGGSAGTVGWYLIQGDSVYLNGERMYARGLITPEVLRLVFVDPLVAGVGGKEYEMPFKRETADAQPQEQGQQGGGEQGS